MGERSGELLRDEEVIPESRTVTLPPSRLALTDVIEQRGGGRWGYSEAHARLVGRRARRRG